MFSGSLKDFSLAEILQLIGTQQKTGILTLTNPFNKTIEIYFQEGKMVKASRKEYDDEGVLKEYLIKAEIISLSHLQRIQHLQEKTFKTLPEIAIETNYINTETMNKILWRKTLEIIYRAFEFNDGVYQFDVTEVVPTKDMIPPLEVETIITNHKAMEEEWPNFRRLFPVVELILRRSGDISPAIINELSDDERQVVQVIQGDTSIQKVLDKSLLLEYDVYKTIQSLLQKGVITKREDSVIIRYKKKTLHGISLVLMIIVLATLVGIGYLVKLSLEKPKGEQSPSMFVDYYKIQLMKILELYYIDKGFYPNSLEELKAEGYVPFYFNTRKFFYRQQEKGFILKDLHY